jgi:hypothetical protein
MCDPNWGREAQKKAENEPPFQYQQQQQQQQQQIQTRFGSHVRQQPPFSLLPTTSAQSQTKSQTQSQTQTEWVYKGPSIHTFGFGSDHSADLLKYLSYFNFLHPVNHLNYNPISFIFSFFNSFIIHSSFCLKTDTYYFRAIADKANGVYFFVENPDSTPSSFFFPSFFHCHSHSRLLSFYEYISIT